MKKIGILTFHASYNYGSMLQAFALQYILKRENLDCKIINFRTLRQKNMYSVYPKQVDLLKRTKSLLKRIVFRSILSKNKNFEYFLHNFLDLTNEYSTYKELSNKCPNFDYYISGSDQIWNPVTIDFQIAYFLPFVKEGKRIAYAPSFGATESVNNVSLRHKIAKCLLRYDHISVREEQSVKLIRSLINVDVPVVLDPVLLMKRDEWLKFIPSEKPIYQNYILFYTLYDDIEMDRCAKILSKKLNLPIVITKYNTYDLKQLILRRHYIKQTESGPLQFLNLINNAKLVFSSSFHGTAFSILLNKAFYSYKGNLDPRAATLLKKVDLQERSISIKDIGTKCKDAFNIDFNRSNSLLSKERKKSLEFLFRSVDL